MSSSHSQATLFAVTVHGMVSCRQSVTLGHDQRDQRRRERGDLTVNRQVDRRGHCWFQLSDMIACPAGLLPPTLQISMSDRCPAT